MQKWQWHALLGFEHDREHNERCFATHGDGVTGSFLLILNNGSGSVKRDGSEMGVWHVYIYFVCGEDSL